MEKVGIFYGHLEYTTAIWSILWSFGNLHSGTLVHFPPFWYVVARKIWQPCTRHWHLGANFTLRRQLFFRRREIRLKTALWQSFRKLHALNI
jgi:hypothetical protein